MLLRHLYQHSKVNKKTFCFSSDLSKGYVVGPWIGLNDPNKQNSWEWTDGTPFSYSNWSKGEPSTLEQHCVQVSKIIFYKCK